MYYVHKLFDLYVHARGNVIDVGIGIVASGMVAAMVGNRIEGMEVDTLA